MRRRTRVIGGLLAAIGALWGLGGTVFAADHTVTIQGFAFGPDAVTVTVGDTVTWSNQDNVGHTATAGDGTFDTGTISAGGTASATFSTAGTFAYACAIHPSMTGTVVVEAASNAGGGSSGGGEPPATDTVAPTTRTGSHSPDGTLAAWLAVLGVTMAIGTLVFDRRAEARRRTD